MLSRLAQTSLVAVSLGLAAPALAQDATPPEEISGAVEAAQSAGAVDALVGGDPVTVFVPTNDALAAAPQDALADLTSDPERLATVIQGYAVPGTVMAADAMSMATDAGGSTTVESLGGGTLTVMVEGDSVMVGPEGGTMATVVTPDLQLGNVTIHVIDTAFLPG